MDDKLKPISVDKSNEPSIMSSLIPFSGSNEDFNKYYKNGYLMIPLKDILNMSVDEELMSCAKQFEE